MTTIGTAVLQIIPSLDGVSKSIDTQLGGTLRASGRAGGKQLAKGVGEGLKDLEREVEAAGKAYQKLRDRAVDSLDTIRVREATLKRLKESGRANDDQILRAEAALSKSRRDSARATREAEDGYKSLSAAHTALAASSGNLGANLGGVALAASKLGPVLATGAAAAGAAAIGGIALLAAGAVKATSELYQLGASFDETFDSLRVKTGATGPQLKALEDATKRISAGVPLAIGDIGAVVGETSRALHLTGSDLDDVSKNIANLGRLTGENVDVRTLGKAFRGFGVDAKDQVPALDSLFRASQATGVGVNELLATVVKGGAGLRQFGFDFGQSAALATQFEASGLDADKAMTGLTKGLASLAKNGQTGQQALKDNVAQIKNLIATGNDAAALDLTNKLFGAKGGVQFFEAIKNGALDLDTLSASLAGTGDTIAAAAKDTDDWSEKWQELKNQAAVALEPLASGLFDGINEELSKAGDALVEHKAGIVDFFESIGDIAITGAENVSHGIGGILQAFGDMVGGIGNVKGLLDDLMGDFATLRGDNAGAAAFHASAQEAYGWGESLRAAGDKLANLNLDGLRDGLHRAGDEAKASGDKVYGLGTSLGALPRSKTISVNADTAPAEQTMQSWWAKWKAVIAAAPSDMPDDTSRPVIHPTDKPPAPSGGPPPVPSLLDPNRPHFSFGGAASGPGGPTADRIPAWLSNGEHVFTAKDVAAMGGQAGVYAFRKVLHRSGGGSIFPMAQIPWPPGKINKTGDRAGNVPNLDSGFNPSQRALPWLLDPDSPIPSGPPGVPLPPTDDDILFPDSQPWWMRKWLEDHPPSSWKNPHRNMLLGAGLGFAGGGGVGGGLMSTKNAAEWLAARGFVAGAGGPGQVSVGWYDHGPNPNDGHMAMTLSNGQNAEAGGSSGPFTVGSSTGANSPKFDHHMYLPTVWGEGPAGSGSASSPFAGGSAVAAATSGGGGDLGGFTKATGGGGTSSGGGGGSISVPSSLSGFGSSIGQQLGSLGNNLGGGKLGDLGKLGSAAGSLVDGQIASALDVFGIPTDPPWLKAISTFIGGISIGGGGGSASPLAASPDLGGFTKGGDGADPGNMHGARAGQAPGPTYNITARDTEDAFVKAQRVEREKSAAKLSRF
jgi:phage-related minor tail protein